MRITLMQPTQKPCGWFAVLYIFFIDFWLANEQLILSKGNCFTLYQIKIRREKMNSNKKNTRILEDVKVNVKIKLSALWASVMFLFVYVDIMGKYEPGHLEDAIAGKIAGFQITQGWLLGVTIMMAIPSLMAFLSVALKPNVNRWVNIVVAIFKIIVVVGSLFIGVPWGYYIFGSILELFLLSLIIWNAVKWPKQEV